MFKSCGNLCLVILLLGTVAVSCNKDILQTPTQRLVGKWKQTQYATDDNHNKSLDAAEISNVQISLTDEISFNADSTGVETVAVEGSKTNYPFIWLVFPNGQIVRYGVGRDTFVYTIQSVSANGLTLQTSNANGLAWYIYARE
jgi:hypothetical protein